MRKHSIVIIALLTIAALFLLFFVNGEEVGLRSVMKFASGAGKNITIVIDPGHGGIDGGAESKGGVCEKDINLAISLALRDLAEEAGWKVIMTRDKDEGLYEEGKGSIRSKKVEDIKKRQEIINDSDADGAISIHLNSYPSQSVKGAQTFYSKRSEEGKVIAEMIQERIRQDVDPENQRQALTKDDIAIMKNNTFPLVLVECGFLSNDIEIELLQTEDYQKKLAKCIFSSLKDYFVAVGKLEMVEMQVVEGEQTR